MSASVQSMANGGKFEYFDSHLMGLTATPNNQLNYVLTETSKTNLPCGPNNGGGAHAYTGLLPEHGFQISMSRRVNPYDNALAESFSRPSNAKRCN